MGPNSRGCSLLGRGEELESAQAMQCCKCVGLQRRWAEVVLADWEPLRQQISPSLYSWSLKSRQLQLCSNKFVTRSHCCSLSIILLAHWQQDKNSPASFPRQRQPGPSQNWDWSTCAAARMQFLSKNVVCYGTALIFPYCPWCLPTHHEVQPLCHSTQQKPFQISTVLCTDTLNQPPHRSF